MFYQFRVRVRPKLVQGINKILAKIEKKGKTKEELNKIIRWLTGYSEQELTSFLESDATLEEFFAQCTLHPNTQQIKGVICGYRVEEMEESLLKQVRYLDKLVDELARGKKMENILRGSA